jgi:hypothetical protein
LRFCRTLWAFWFSRLDQHCWCYGSCFAVIADLRHLGSRLPVGLRYGLPMPPGLGFCRGRPPGVFYLTIRGPQYFTKPSKVYLRVIGDYFFFYRGQNSIRHPITVITSILDIVIVPWVPPSQPTNQLISSCIFQLCGTIHYRYAYIFLF